MLNNARTDLRVTGFRVRHQDVKSFASQVGRAKDDTSEAIEYVQRSCDMITLDTGPLSVLAGIANGGHGDVLENVNDALRKMRRILSTSEEELKQVSVHYQDTDLDTARKMDATYSEVKR